MATEEEDLAQPVSSAREFLKAIRENVPYIRPYDEDDLDWTWADEGMEFLEAGDYAMAELKFQELIAAQPKHCDGYEGLALVYEAVGRTEQAAVLIDEAVRIARDHVRRGLVDQEVLDAILEEQARIRGPRPEPRSEEDPR